MKTIGPAYTDQNLHPVDAICKARASIAPRRRSMRRHTEEYVGRFLLGVVLGLGKQMMYGNYEVWIIRVVFKQTQVQFRIKSCGVVQRK